MAQSNNPWDIPTPIDTFDSNGELAIEFTDLTNGQIDQMSDHTLLVLLVIFARDTAKGMEEFYSRMRSNPITRMFGG